MFLTQSIGVLLVGLLSLIGVSGTVEKTGKLVFAHVMFRHGDRTPIDPYPNDPYGTASAWDGVDWGQLTNVGKRQHYELGKWLRNRYGELVNEIYDHNQIYIRSTDVERTLQSALANLAGFYPPKGRDVWLDGMNWQPIPIHTTQEKLDPLLASKKACPAYEYALKKRRRSEEYRELNKKLKELYEYVSENSGRTYNSIEGIGQIYSCLLIEHMHNKTLPTWTESIFPDELDWVSAKAFQTYCSTPQLARLKSGPILKEMLERFRNKTLGTLKPDRSVWFYSAHDTTVANLLNILGLFDPPHNPPFAACVMLEMRLIDDKPYISVFYKNTTAEPQPMNIPRCGRSCPLDKMFDLYRDVLPVDWEAECKLPLMTMSYEEVDNSSPASPMNNVFDMCHRNDLRDFFECNGSTESICQHPGMTFFGQFLLN
ncbi:prostatic acid phosphatase isoform X2 [Phlebotomus papatasi]|uniref:prostatic acid phosphatase isoform X2 n=1 Tax=Phlebotomus papatasi TaxID=29031 RepID=UPI002483D8D6|nr:prostatic acid phosphatase isoform X2 [Phlebotomus papatasi]